MIFPMLNISLRYNRSIEKKLPKQKAFRESQRSDCQIATFWVSSDFTDEQRKGLSSLPLEKIKIIYKY